MPLFFACSIFIVVLAAVTAYGYRAYVLPARVYDQLASSQTRSHDSKSTKLKDLTNFVYRIGSKLPFDVERASRIRQQLIASGYRSERAVVITAGIRALILFSALGFAFFAVPAAGLQRLMVMMAAGLFAYRLPEWVLRAIVHRRKEALRLSLPDALDLIVICAEAGLALDQAIRNVTREIQMTHPELSDEFRLMSLEMTAGTSRAQALGNLAKRTGEPELQKFCSVLVQADRFGTNLSEALRTHAEFMRTRRRQAAEARAGRISVKLVFPIFFLILPSILLIAIGPAVISIQKNLFPIFATMGK